MPPLPNEFHLAALRCGEVECSSDRWYDLASAVEAGQDLAECPTCEWVEVRGEDGDVVWKSKPRSGW